MWVVPANPSGLVEAKQTGKEQKQRQNIIHVRQSFAKTSVWLLHFHPHWLLVCCCFHKVTNSTGAYRYNPGVHRVLLPTAKMYRSSVWVQLILTEWYYILIISSTSTCQSYSPATMETASSGIVIVRGNTLSSWNGSFNVGNGISFFP